MCRSYAVDVFSGSPSLWATSLPARCHIACLSTRPTGRKTNCVTPSVIGNARRREIGRVRGFDFCVFASLHDILFQLAGGPRLRLDPPYRLGPPRHRNQEKSVIVRRLEESAEGCRWLLARSDELLDIINCVAAWGDAEIVRLVGLLGKRGIALLPSHPPTRTGRWYSSARPSSGRSGGSRSCWPSMRTSRPTRRPSGTTARALDCSRGFERHRQEPVGADAGAAAHAGRLPENAEGRIRNGGNGRWQMPDGRRRRPDGKKANGRRRKAETRWQMVDARWRTGKSQTANRGRQMADEQGETADGGREEGRG